MSDTSSSSSCPLAMFRPREPEPSPPPRRAGSWSARLAWITLVGGAALLTMRLSVATVVRVHGDGMSPTLIEGDYVLIVRESWSVERGDIVVYEPSLAIGPGLEADNLDHDDPRARNGDGDEFPDARRDPAGRLRNTAVVDREELEANWRRVQQKSRGIAAREVMPMRLGRVLAVPGSRVAFNVAGAPLGIEIEGAPLLCKPEPNAATAYETTAERRYAVSLGRDPDDPRWPGLELPAPTSGPVEVQAEGYLVVADNRDEGACCDSRALGWIPKDALRGKVAFRLSGAADPSAQGHAPAMRWDP